MTPDAPLPCPRCGSPAQGVFCSSCGAPLKGATCGACGKPLSPGATFCHNCGAPAAAAAMVAGARRGERAPWFVTGFVLVVLLAFVIGQQVGRRSAPAGVAADSPDSPIGASVRAPDISSMSPQERATRLFNRVMRYSEAGMADSAAFFAPMAIQAYEMIGPLDTHARYDIGVIAAVSGAVPLARAQADTILRGAPAHLLGLALAARAADLAHDPTARAGFEKRLLAAEKVERPKNLPEYAEHQHDIDAALDAARKRTR